MKKTVAILLAVVLALATNGCGVMLGLSAGAAGTYYVATTYTTCPHCGKVIPRDELVCRHCHLHVLRESGPDNTPERWANLKLATADECE